MPWTFYPIFIGTVISICSWLYFVRREHDPLHPLTLSELGAARPDTLRYYRATLWICDPLFAITMFLYIAPRSSHRLLLTILWSMTFAAVALTGIFPARGKLVSLHDFISLIMGLGMLAIGLVFTWNLHGISRLVEAFLSAVLAYMIGLVAFFYYHRRQLIHYELILIFSSHLTMVVAAIALMVS